MELGGFVGYTISFANPAQLLPGLLMSYLSSHCCLLSSHRQYHGACCPCQPRRDSSVSFPCGLGVPAREATWTESVC